MTDYSEHEMYLKKMLSNSIGSLNPSQEAKNRARKLSYSYFEDYKQKLICDYEGKELSDIPNSKVTSTSYGDTLKITHKEKVNFKISDNDFKNQMNSNLKLLPKIGVKTEQNLKNKGYSTIESLQNHDKYCDVASKFVNQVDDLSFGEIIELLDKNKYTKKCRDNVVRAISMVDKEDFKFMDIETLGLSNVPIILIGVAEIKGDTITSSQYFLRDIYEEPAVIEAYLSHLTEESVHVTFNGKSFDVPYIRNRCLSNRIDLDFRLPHLDLMYFAKNLWGDELPNCQLQTIEKELFGIEREGDVPGQHIPNYYRTYLSEENIGPIVPIIEHNRQDIISLASFLEKMYEDVN
ncbi:ribonuclease H-like domain-containing protein [Methanobrevibacter sp.]|uniref:ribonuclease H-like domain-containing protein n=1 Tax=Methanobrevibacter sp. TaxID=66852 RepID=UPI00388FAE3A